MRGSMLLVAVALAACGDAPARFIDAARDAHAQADALVRAGDPARAARVLEDFTARAVPAGIAAQDRRVVLQDTHDRLAELALKTGNPGRARDAATAGLALGEGRDAFTASLLTLRGHAEEALGRDVEAARDYEAAQKIAEALLEQALADGGAR